MNPFDYIEQPEKLKRLRIGSCLVLAIVLAADFIIPRDHVVFWWDSVPGFDAGFGFVSCIAIIAVSKTIGHLGIMQKENFYEKEAEDD
jgi:hypothetical protein